MNRDWQALQSLLMLIHTRLDEPLTLRRLADFAGLSTFQLHRWFQRRIGETPRAYVERQRLEQARFRLLVQNAPLTRIAADCGFSCSDSFTRAFRRRYGESPDRWRGESAPKSDPKVIADSAGNPEPTLSATRHVRLQALHLATLRHIGPYENVPQTLFDRLASWADQRCLREPRIWMGIGHDAPGITPPQALRFDAALVIGETFAPDSAIAHQILAGGDFAITTHVGPYSTLPQAYATILQRLLKHRRWTPRGLPAIEVYQSTRVDVGALVNHTDLLLPIELVARPESCHEYRHAS